MDEPGKPRVDWEDFRDLVIGLVLLGGLIWGADKAWPHAKALVNEYRCELRLRDYLRRVVPVQRNPDVDKCKLPDAASGYCFVSSLGEDGARRVEAVPVAMTSKDGIDVTRFLDDAGHRVGKGLPVMAVEDAILTAIAATGPRPALIE